MADILIRGMELPRDCSVCELSQKRVFASSVMCPITGQTVGYYDHGFHLEKHDCPLVPLPEGHGRLIDGDALWEKMYHLSDNEGAHKDSPVDDALILRDSACYLIEEAPTIVPAEGEIDNA